VPIIDGDTIYVNAWEIGGDPGQQRETPAWEEALAKHDADGDKRISRQEADARMLQGNFWKDTDLDEDGFFDQRDWDFYRARSSPTNNLIAIRPADRRGDVTDSAVVWRFNKALPNTSSPLLYEGVIYLVKDGGIATTVDAATGEAIKQERLRHAMDKYWASPVAGDGKVFLVSEACAVTTLRAGGAWEIMAMNKIEDHCFATPAVADGRIYLRTASALYCFGKTSDSGAAARLE
jgi:outer membrane protein assembly factor BamB